MARRSFVRRKNEVMRQGWINMHGNDPHPCIRPCPHACILPPSEIVRVRTRGRCLMIGDLPSTPSHCGCVMLLCRDNCMCVTRQEGMRTTTPSRCGVETSTLVNPHAEFYLQLITVS